MSARFSYFLALGFLMACRVSFAADADTETFAPKTYGVDRYQHIWKRSPFIVETVAAVQSPGLASKYGLVGIASLGKSPVVFLWDKNESDPAKSRFMVSQAKADTIHNIEVVSVAVDKDPRKSTATIKQGADQALLQFDQSGIPPSGPGAGGGGIIPPPVTSSGYVPPVMGSNYIPPATTGAVPPPPPGMNPAVRGLLPTAPAGQVNPATPGQIQPPPVRRIIRPKPIDAN
ncbi:MAG TPA: hypothetical protein VNB29_07835 [Chthoniobacterales bacterium]|jgi:hypothetical protein|nr:hypothetical protein [Chthoniobacterales bacterium]